MTARRPARYFSSGSNYPADIRGLAQLGRDVGVTATHLSPNALAEIRRLAHRVDVFVDSGAFSEVSFRGGWHVVKPITDADWAQILDTYEQVARWLGAGAHVVAPDQVGNQGETLARLRRYSDRLQVVAGYDATILLPLQGGELSLLDFEDAAREALGFPRHLDYTITPAIPCKKGATSDDAIVAYCAARQPRRIHLLGKGANNPGLPRLLDAIAEVSPGTRVQCDSCWIAAKAGTTGGVGGGARPLTAARNQIAETYADSSPRQVQQYAVASVAFDELVTEIARLESTGSDRARLSKLRALHPASPQAVAERRRSGGLWWDNRPDAPAPTPKAPARRPTRPTTLSEMVPQHLRPDDEAEASSALLVELTATVRRSRAALKQTTDLDLLGRAAQLATSRETRRQIERRIRVLTTPQETP